jgi:hypothetical protein
MDTVIGYSIAGVGLAILAFGSAGNIIPIDNFIINIIGGACVVIGVVNVTMAERKTGGKSKKAKKGKKGEQADHDDLPVYQGNDIVAYRRGDSDNK